MASGEDSIVIVFCKKRKGGKNPLNTDDLNSFYDWGHSVITQVTDGQFLSSAILMLWDIWFRSQVSFWKRKQGM